MKTTTKPQGYDTTYQLKLPLEISTIIEVSDPVYTFCEVMDHIDLRKYLVTEDKKYNENPYRAVNFNINENGNLICPNNKETNTGEKKNIINVKIVLAVHTKNNVVKARETE